MVMPYFIIMMILFPAHLLEKSDHLLQLSDGQKKLIFIPRCHHLMYT